MLCPKCKGTVIKKDDVFECTECGAHFKGKAAKKVEPDNVVAQASLETEEFTPSQDPFDVEEGKEFTPESDSYDTGGIASAPLHTETSSSSLDSYVKNNPKDPEGFYRKASEMVEGDTNISESTYKIILRAALDNADPNYVESYIGMVNKLRAINKKSQVKAQNIYENVTPSNGKPLPTRTLATSSNKSTSSILSKITQTSGGTTAQKSTRKSQKVSSERTQTVSRGKSLLVLLGVIAYIALVMIVIFVLPINVAMKSIITSSAILLPLIIGLLIVFIRKLAKRNPSKSRNPKTKFIALGVVGGLIVAAAAVILIGAIPTVDYRKVPESNVVTAEFNDNTILTSYGETTKLDNYNGALSNNDYVACGIKGLYMPFHFNMTSIKISDTVNGRKVVAISNEAFMNQNGIKNVTIGANVKYIGTRAFYGCSNLVKVELNQAVEKIENTAFNSTGTSMKITYPGTKANLETVFDRAKNYDVTYGNASGGTQSSSSGGSVTPSSRYFTITNDSSYPWDIISYSDTSLLVRITNTTNLAKTKFRLTFKSEGRLDYMYSGSTSSSNYMMIYKNSTTGADKTYGNSSKNNHTNVLTGYFVEFEYTRVNMSSTGYFDLSITFTPASSTPSTSGSSSSTPSRSSSGSSSSSGSTVPTSQYYTITNDSSYPWTIQKTEEDVIVASIRDVSGLYRTKIRFTLRTAGEFQFSFVGLTASNNYMMLHKNGGTGTYKTYGNQNITDSINVSAGDYVEFEYTRVNTSSADYYEAYMYFIPDGVTPSTSSSSSSSRSSSSSSSSRSGSSNSYSESGGTPSSQYFTVRNDSYYPWNTTTTSITSTNKTNSSSSKYRFTFQSSGTFSFDAQASSESGCDFLKVYKNGVENTALRISGTSTLTNKTISITAGDYVEFEYSKDNSVNSGNDCVTVSNILFTSSSQSSGSSSSQGSSESQYYIITNDRSHPWEIYDTTSTEGSYYCRDSFSTGRSTIRFTFYQLGYAEFHITVNSNTANKISIYVNGSTESIRDITGTTGATIGRTMNAQDYIEFTYDKSNSTINTSNYASFSLVFAPSDYTGSGSGIYDHPVSQYFATTNDSSNPWDTTATSITSTNHDNNSISIYRFTFLSVGTFRFSSRTSTEQYDILYVFKNGTEISTLRLSGTSSVPNNAIEVDEGDTVEFWYSKNSSLRSGDDQVTIYDIGFTEGSSGTNVVFTNDTTYPWTVETNTYTSTNKTNPSSSKCRFTFSQSGYFYYDVAVSSEKKCDYFNVYINGIKDNALTRSGDSTAINQCQYVSAGDYIEFEYVKDQSVNGLNDNVVLSNVYFVKTN